MEGKPIWVLRRSAASITALAAHEAVLTAPDSQHSLQPAACRNRHRSLRPEIFVAIGLWTHQGCVPALRGDSGFLCPCHVSRYDIAGRVFKTGPATANLVIPAYHFKSDSRMLLGVDAWDWALAGITAGCAPPLVGERVPARRQRSGPATRSRRAQIQAPCLRTRWRCRHATNAPGRPPPPPG